METPATEICGELESYITNYFGQTEAVLFDRKNAIGYLSVIYFQRLVSSFNSAYETLKKRNEKLRSWVESNFDNIEIEDPSDDESDEMAMRLLSSIDDNTKRLAGIKCRQELDTIAPILHKLVGFIEANSANDPKLKELVRIVQDIISKNERLLIFSKYTDTTAAIIPMLESVFDSAGAGYAYYSGGDCWICVSGRRFTTTKNDIVVSLNSGEIACVICTDAASEGLNLQAARHLINVDVPWNPARMEQRFGRIDRLGQVADEVHFYNLWYPGSIEERMYGAIQSRGQAIGFSLGVMSDTLGVAIRQHLSGRLGSHNLDLGQALDAVRQSQEQINLSSIEYACGSLAHADAQGNEFRSGLLRLVLALPGAVEMGEGCVQYGGKIYSDKLGSTRGETVMLSSKCFASDIDLHGCRKDGFSVHIITRGNIPMCAAVCCSGGFRILSASETVAAARAMRVGGVIRLSGSEDIPFGKVDDQTIDSAITRRFGGRICSDRIVFDQVLPSLARSIEARIPRENFTYCVQDQPCGYIQVVLGE
jgi:hypothetical protein